MIEIECDNCHKMFKTYECYLKRKRKHRFCSRECEGDFKSYHNSLEDWQGGWISPTNGYKYVRYKGKPIEEHRLVMMKKLNRDLKQDEQVHHINKNRLDNREENLMLLTQKEHMSLHAKMKNNKRTCLICNEYKIHHARGLCATCYHRVLMEGRLNEYKKQI